VLAFEVEIFNTLAKFLNGFDSRNEIAISKFPKINFRALSYVFLEAVVEIAAVYENNRSFHHSSPLSNQEV
jgi:hypothetical protein